MLSEGKFYLILLLNYLGCKGDSAEEIFKVCELFSNSEERHKEMK